MKNIVYIATLLTCSSVFAQDFSANLATAKSSYAGGNLEDARFAMQQMMNELDVAIGREVLKLLPSQFASSAANTASDNVTANTGLAGVMIHRDYGKSEELINLDVMGNSPMIASINAILSLPFIGNSGDGTQKVVKINGYKAVLQKSVDSETNRTDFTLQVPINSTLVTLTVPNSNEAEVLKMANTIPVQQIAAMVQ